VLLCGRYFPACEGRSGKSLTVSDAGTRTLSPVCPNLSLRDDAVP
jgi:hypothetical protein